VAEPTRLVLVRHGESEWNAERRLQGHGGTGLTALGAAQAGAVAEHLRGAYPQVDLMVRSDLPRVAETAAPWETGFSGTVRLDRRWREIDVGSWSGLTWDEVAERDPETLAAWRAGIDVRRGGAETFAELRARVWTAIDALRGTGGVVVVFTHGGPIRVGVAEALGLPPLGESALAEIANCAITELVLYESSTVLAAYNVADHLASLDGEAVDDQLRR